MNQSPSVPIYDKVHGLLQPAAAFAWQPAASGQPNNESVPQRADSAKLAARLHRPKRQQAVAVQGLITQPAASNFRKYSIVRSSP